MVLPETGIVPENPVTVFKLVQGEKIGSGGFVGQFR
jgi:hypothetical protein